jgi:hypothetical protein
LNEAARNLEEGIVLKDLRAPYVLGEEGRKRAYWVKVCY